MRRSAVIDNATLVNLTKLKHLYIFDSLRLLFNQIHIPQEVAKEYEIQRAKEPERVWVLERLRPNEGFYSFCTQYDSGVLGILNGQKHIDKGEAEAVAQQKRVNAHYILSDDIKFKNAIRSIDSKVRVFSTLHIIAMLDIRQFIIDYEVIVKTLHSVHQFESSHLRLAYMESARELGIKLTKKALNSKCSFKKLRLR